jgi:hypothetical protein
MSATDYHIMVSWVRDSPDPRMNHLTSGRAVVMSVEDGTTEMQLLEQVQEYFRRSEGIGVNDNAAMIFYRAVPNQLPASRGPRDC